MHEIYMDVTQVKIIPRMGGWSVQYKGRDKFFTSLEDAKFFKKYLERDSDRSGYGCT